MNYNAKLDSLSDTSMCIVTVSIIGYEAKWYNTKKGFSVTFGYIQSERKDQALYKFMLHVIRKEAIKRLNLFVIWSVMWQLDIKMK